MGKKLKPLLSKVLKKIVPTKQELKKEKTAIEKLIKKIKELEGPHIEAILGGSMSRNTHLRGDNDIDLFVLFPEKLSRQEFEKEGLKIGKKILRGKKWEMAFSEHPYIRGNLEGFDIEIVPSYQISSTELLKSNVDRSPFHTKYLNQKLSEKQKNEVRLLRQFLKGIKCYGADLKAASMPGYVTELLILMYGDFEKTLKNVAEWRVKEVIDLEKHWNEKDARKKFDSTLIVIDPVDKNRNVAAALSLNQFSRFVAASRIFLKKPSKHFFFGKKTIPWPKNKVKQMLKKKELIAVEIGFPKVLADIIWGQMKRIRRKTANQLELNGFKVLRGAEWTDEKRHIMLVFELEALELQKICKRIGPMVIDALNGMRFLNAHKGKTAAGPRIESGRWVIETERKYCKAANFLKDYLRKLKRQEKASVRKALNKKSRVLNEKQLLQLYSKHKEFKKFFTQYLKGKEEFEEY